MTDAFVTVTQTLSLPRVLDRHDLEIPLDDTRMAPVTGVKRKRVETEPSELRSSLPTTV